MAGDLVASSAAPAVKSEPRIPTQTKPQVKAQVFLIYLYSLYNYLQLHQNHIFFLGLLHIQLEAGADNALDALSDTLGDIKPVPQPAPRPVKDPVKVASIV